MAVPRGTLLLAAEGGRSPRAGGTSVAPSKAGGMVGGKFGGTVVLSGLARGTLAGLAEDVL